MPLDPVRPNEIVPLTSIRGLAALWVLALHLSHAAINSIYNPAISGPVELSGIGLNLVNNGGFAVDIFFVLSGYIMVANYGLAINPGKFLVHRFARIYPLHIAILATMAAGVAVMAAFGINPQRVEDVSWKALPYHLTLTYVWFGMPAGWNSPAWSLSAEVAAYLTFPFLQYLAALVRSRPGMLLIAILLVAAQGAWLYSFEFTLTGTGAVGRAILGFSAGMAVRLATAGLSTPSWLGVACLAAIAACAAADVVSIAVAPTALLLVCLAGPVENRLQRAMSFSGLKWVGDISYSIYLLHAPMLIVLIMIAKQFSDLRAGVGMWLLIIGYLVALMLTSDLSWRLIETPARKFVRTRFSFLTRTPRAETGAGLNW